MKITLNIDEALLDRVVKITGSATKTEAIHHALREIDRKSRLIKVLREGLGASSDELRSMFDPASDPVTLRAAEPTAPYGATGEPEP